MPGLVVRVAVAAGEEVAAGQKLLTLEAMKMETTLYAERAGRVAEVLVTAGDAGEHQAAADGRERRGRREPGLGVAGRALSDRAPRGPGGQRVDQPSRTAGSGAPSASQLAASACQVAGARGTSPLAVRSR